MNLKKIVAVAAFSFVLASCALPSLEDYKTKLVDAGYEVEIYTADDSEASLLFSGEYELSQLLVAGKGDILSSSFELAFIFNFVSANVANEYFADLIELSGSAGNGYYAKSASYVYVSTGENFFTTIGVTPQQ
jgi:hypothetical protein